MEPREQFTTYEDAFYPLVTLARLVIVREDGRAYAAIAAIPFDATEMRGERWAQDQAARLRRIVNDDPERFLISPGVSPQWV